MLQRGSSRWRAAVAATALVVVVGSLVGARSAVAAPASVREAPAPARYGGEELLRGLFFGDGPVAQAYPGLARGHTDGTLAGARLVDRLVNDVRSQDAAFFKRFAADLYSGDRVAILNALERASVAVQASISRVLPGAERQVVTDPAGKRTGVIVLVLVAAAVTVVAVVVAVIEDKRIKSPMHLRGQLDGELWVDAIATALSPA